ncbi:MAG: hypothetical protein GC205_08470 [Bacteroidetes bacterium]|nr:hypothetical protein [Bacteroidota bacterium]
MKHFFSGILCLYCIIGITGLVSGQTSPFEKSLPCGQNARPFPLKSQLLSDTQALLQWNPVPQTAAYHVVVQGAALSTGPLLDTFLTDAQVQVEELPLGQLLTWTVQAQCQQGALSAWGHADTFAFPDPDFDCGDLLVDMRDGEAYRTVQMGSQCWFQQNLNHDLGEGVFGFSTGFNCNTPAKAGRFYNWTAGKGIDSAYAFIIYGAEGEQGACPVGWHLPTISEYDLLFSDTSITFTTVQIGGGSGFDVHLGGYMNTGERFTQVETSAFLITSSQSPYTDWRMMVYALDGRFTNSIERGEITKICRGSIRCLKD